MVFVTGATAGPGEHAAGEGRARGNETGRASGDGVDGTGQDGTGWTGQDGQDGTKVYWET